jgi:hypothetical protein
MNQRPQIYLYSTLAAGFAVMAYLSLRRNTNADKIEEIGRTTKQIQSQIEDIYSLLSTERRRIDDLVEYIRPLREYSKNRPQTL